MSSRISSVIKKAIQFLKRSQTQNGSFSSYSSLDQESFLGAQKLKNNFLPILILDCLNAAQFYPETRKIQKKLVSYLLKQRSQNWTWNFWVKYSHEEKTQTYPDDMDDTFCALASLYRYDMKLITGEALSTITRVLLHQEKNVGGPYKTWFVSSKQGEIWQDIDLAVNVNIGYFLSLLGAKIPNITQMIGTAILSNNFTSSYYDQPLPILYFIARWYGSEHKDILKNHIFSLRKKQKNWGNPLNTALAVSSLLRLGADFSELEAPIQSILDQQQNNGAWKAESFFPNPTIKKKKYFAGSPALSTAMCIEALSEYSQRLNALNKASTKTKTPQQNIFSNIEKIFNTFSKELTQTTHPFLEKSKKMDQNGSISLLPYTFVHCLHKKYREAISENQLVELGTGNLLGWMAYTVYDDILDDKRDTNLLPLANTCLRELVLLLFPYFQKEPSVFQQFFHKMEQANLWEIHNCRFPASKTWVLHKYQLPEFGDYTKLAEKSCGHLLGPLAILLHLGFNSTSPEFKNLQSFFSHYLIARQLDDDAHDWRSDLIRGQINPVGNFVLQKYFSFSKKNTIAINIKNLKQLEKIFWNSEVDTISKLISKYCKNGSNFLIKDTLLQNKKPFLQLLQKHEESARSAILEKNKILQFIHQENPGNRLIRQ